MCHWIQIVCITLNPTLNPKPRSFYRIIISSEEPSGCLNSIEKGITCILFSFIFLCYREIPKFSYIWRILWFWVSEGLMGCPRSDLEKGIVENGDVKEPLLHDGTKNKKFKRWKFKIKKDSDAQGSAATAIFCTAIAALGLSSLGTV